MKEESLAMVSLGFFAEPVIHGLSIRKALGFNKTRHGQCPRAFREVAHSALVVPDDNRANTMDDDWAEIHVP